MRKQRDTDLTAREAQVLRHVAQGLTNKEVGRELGISPETVKDRLRSIMVKTNTQTRTEASVWAVRWGGQ